MTEVLPELFPISTFIERVSENRPNMMRTAKPKRCSVGNEKSADQSCCMATAMPARTTAVMNRCSREDFKSRKRPPRATNISPKM